MLAEPCLVWQRSFLREADGHQGTDIESIRRALHRIDRVPFRGQPVPLERLKARDLSRPGLPETLKPARWCGSAKVWLPVTPVALDKYPGFLFGRARKTDDEVTRTEKALAEARASLRQSCVNIGLPAPWASTWPVSHGWSLRPPCPRS